MKVNMIATLVLLVIVLSPVAAVSTGRLQIHVPADLYKDGGYDHRLALFGIPAYGGSLAQNVYYADSDLCDRNVDKTRGYPWPAPFILMVDRGGCTFVTKVRNAQDAGATGVVIADNTCLCSDVNCRSNEPCEPTEPIMADDGSGSDISVPAVLMFKTDADRIKETVKQNRPVLLEMAWSLAEPDKHVEYALWTTPGDVYSATFLSTFKDLAVVFGKQAFFTPYMHIFDGLRMGCQGVNGENQCLGLCTNNGRYCALPPANLDGVSGALVVAESLRRTCIWSFYGSENGIGEKWWDYVTEFAKRCETNKDYFSSPDCIKDVYRRAGIEGTRIERCMVDSGGLEGNAPNAKLDMAIMNQAATGVTTIPSAIVDNHRLQEELSTKTMFEAICASFDQGSEPKVCSACVGCPDVETCAREGVCLRDCPNPSNHHEHSETTKRGKTKKSVSSAAIFLLVVLCALCVGFGVWFYQREYRQKGGNHHYLAVGVQLG